MCRNKLTAILVFGVFLSIPVNTNAAPILSIGGTSILQDEFVTLPVLITDVIDLYAYQFDVQFDPGLVEVVDVVEGPFLGLGGTTLFIPGAVITPGLLEFTSGTLFDIVPGVSGSGTLASITFRGLASGPLAPSLSNLIFLDSSLSDIHVETPAPAPVPEPSTFLLLASGAALMLRRRRAGPKILLLILVPTFVLNGRSVMAQDVDPATLVWSTNGEASAAGKNIQVGVAGRPENVSQPPALHFASAILPPASSYTVVVRFNLTTWDSYNAPGTPNPPFNGGTGFWDSFSVSVSGSPYTTLSLTDPITPSQVPGLGFLWGGSSYGDVSAESNAATKELTLKGNAGGPNYLNIGLDTGTSPNADSSYPSWGSFEIVSIKGSCDLTTSLSVPLYKQCGQPWKTDTYDHVSATMCSLGCGTTSAAMVLSYHGFPTTPRQLNDWLKSRFTDKNNNGQLDPGEPTYGYLPGGNVNWVEVAAYTNNALTFKGFGTADELDDWLCKGRPTIVRVPGHFVVATGKNASGEVTINDPGYNLTTLTSYTVEGIRKLGPPGSGSFALYFPTSIHAIVTDPLGRRVGSDGNIVFQDVIGSSYTEENIADVDPSDGDQANGITRVLFIPDPSEGVYQISFIGYTGEVAQAHLYRYTKEEKPQVVQSFTVDLPIGAATSRTGTYSTRAGDLNSDGFVNTTDVNIVRAAYGRRRGRAGYDPIADTNADGVIDIRDLSYVTRNVTQ